MKNFSEARAIKPTLKLEVVLRVKPVGTVRSRLQVNDASWITEIAQEEVFKHAVELTDPIDIQIQIARQHPQALEVELEIEGHTILPLYQDALGITTCYIDSTDIWTVKIPNFYPWYHAITGQGWIA